MRETRRLHGETGRERVWTGVKAKAERAGEEREREREKGRRWWKRGPPKSPNRYTQMASSSSPALTAGMGVAGGELAASSYLEQVESAARKSSEGKKKKKMRGIIPQMAWRNKRVLAVSKFEPIIFLRIRPFKSCP